LISGAVLFHQLKVNKTILSGTHTLFCFAKCTGIKCENYNNNIMNNNNNRGWSYILNCSACDRFFHCPTFNASCWFENFKVIFIKEIKKRTPVLCYISTREFLRTWEKCKRRSREARGAAECFSHFSSILKNSQELI